ncbi:hypothetical protein KAI46_12775 [bacterium]|nr:hypothetical protein [bacterium]
MSIQLSPSDMTSYNSVLPLFVSASSEYSAFFASYKAFQSELGSGKYWIALTSSGEWLQLDFGCRNIVEFYYISANTIPEPNRMPKDWTFEGSNDNSTWIVLDSVTGETAWGSGERREFACTTTGAYRYYRVNISANNGDTYIVIAYLELWGMIYDIAIAPLMTAAAAPAPFVASADNNASGREPYEAFNKNLTAGEDYLHIGVAGWLKLDTGVDNTYKVASYALGVNDYPEPDRAPQDWTLEGSNDDSVWDTLDTVTGESNWDSGELRNFVCDTITTSYRYFRVNFTANNGDPGYTQIAYLQFYSEHIYYYITDFVFEAGVPVACDVAVFIRATKALFNITTSAAGDGSFSVEVNDDTTEYFAVAFNDNSGVLKTALVVDHLTGSTGS